MAASGGEKEGYEELMKQSYPWKELGLCLICFKGDPGRMKGLELCSYPISIGRGMGRL